MQKGQITINGDRLYSRRFDEHYASVNSPIDEKHEVFCVGNALPSRFISSNAFTVAELGFGAGLGFLTCSRLWLETAPPNARLHFISFEKHPLNQEQLNLAHAAYPELANLADELRARYPTHHRGFHRLNLYKGKISLTLIFEDALRGLKQLDLPHAHKVDAWFLDGFSPAKNPAMWGSEIFHAMHKLSRAGTTFATYTAAGQVRRDLESAGFYVSKLPGYAGKRERLVGTLSSPARTSSKRPPWLTRQAIVGHKRDITIVGAGIAGCALANRLASRGYEVTLLEKENSLAGAASSNPAAITHPYFTVDNDAIAQLTQSGFLYTLQTIARLSAAGLNTGFHKTCLVMRPKDEADLKRQAAIAIAQAFPDEYAQWLSAAALRELSGVSIRTDGWYFPQGGWLEISVFCQALLDEYPENITLKTSQHIEDFKNTADGWRIYDQNDQECHRTHTLILSHGCGLLDLKNTETFPIIPNRGQVSLLRTKPHSLKTTVCGQGYVIPLSERSLCIGATHSIDSATDQDEQAALLNQLEKTLPDLAACADKNSSMGWTGLRTTLPDRLPLMGAVWEEAAFKTQYANMIVGKAPLLGERPALCKENLFVMTGLGSRGVAYPLICAETLASELSGEPSALPVKVRDAMDSSRFFVRAIKKAAKQQKG